MDTHLAHLLLQGDLQVLVAADQLLEKEGEPLNTIFWALEHGHFGNFTQDLASGGYGLDMKGEYRRLTTKIWPRPGICARAQQEVVPGNEQKEMWRTKKMFYLFFGFFSHPLPRLPSRPPEMRMSKRVSAYR